MRVKTTIVRNAKDPVIIDGYLAHIKCPEFTSCIIRKCKTGWVIEGSYIMATTEQPRMIERYFTTKKKCINHLTVNAIPIQ